MAPRPDSERPDARQPDSRRPDAPRPDSERPDAPRPDSERHDAPRPDSDRHDAPQPDRERPRALLIDWGGVLTTNLFLSFHAYCVSAGIDPRKLTGRFKDDPQARELLIALETGRIPEGEFEARFAAMLGVQPAGLIDGLFAGVKPDEVMLEAVRRAHDAGIRTALVSNSWGVHRYPRQLFEALFDGIVISGEEGIRKPSRRMYLLGAERAGVPPAACAYVDDLPFNLTPARELGMVAIHHTDAQSTVAELEELFGVALRAGAGAGAPVTRR